jgi:hypothetical protein
VTTTPGIGEGRHVPDGDRDAAATLIGPAGGDGVEGVIPAFRATNDVARPAASFSASATLGPLGCVHLTLHVPVPAYVGTAWSLTRPGGVSAGPDTATIGR